MSMPWQNIAATAMNGPHCELNWRTNKMLMAYPVARYISAQTPPLPTHVQKCINNSGSRPSICRDQKSQHPVTGPLSKAINKARTGGLLRKKDKEPCAIHIRVSLHAPQSCVAKAWHLTLLIIYYVILAVREGAALM